MTDQDDPRRGDEVAREVPGTPEEVWDAIATGPGISAWFVPTELEEREGGAVVFHLGLDDAQATITGWEPGRRIAYEEAWPVEEGADPVTLATEFLIEARAGGTCVVRIVSTFDAEGFGDALEGMGEGWTAFLDNLRIYLTHFAGEPAATITVTGTADAPKAEAWAELTRALGLPDAAPGDRVEAGAGDARLAGVVERAEVGDLLLRDARAITGVAVFVWEDRTYTALRLSCFGPDAAAEAAAARAVWEPWMAARFPLAAGAT
jgi:uncharacterized protein YndB with AHSA1/START domain